MIRINLLPFKGKRKKKGAALTIPAPLIAMVVLLVVSLVIASLVFFNLNGKIDRLTETKAARKKELDDLSAKIKDVEDFEKKIIQINKNKNVIVELRRQQSIPVKMLDELGKQLPENVWLSSLNFRDVKITLEGATFTNDDVVKFVNNLKGSKLFTDVYLNVSQSAKEDGQDIYKFSISMQVRT
jgi:type IV pilus assembly protein PilN